MQVEARVRFELATAQSLGSAPVERLQGRNQLGILVRGRQILVLDRLCHLEAPGHSCLAAPCSDVLGRFHAQRPYRAAYFLPQSEIGKLVVPVHSLSFWMPRIDCGSNTQSIGVTAMQPASGSNSGECNTRQVFASVGIVFGADQNPIGVTGPHVPFENPVIGKFADGFFITFQDPA
jgi:hypothetical protein